MRASIIRNNKLRVRQNTSCTVSALKQHSKFRIAGKLSLNRYTSIGMIDYRNVRMPLPSASV
ncbi:hypothetical protein JCM10003_3813 [Bacteroides pyogenes JCM 10003]|nr:hypothetical protein JCM10003_3813 [Bacteroides pyogenes JCM 10003]